jgi:putative thioredoxin
MSEEALIFEVGESGFDRYVIGNSRKVPVLVEFMGVWSEPCVVMADAISDLAREFAGQFVFAKVDVDEQQGLRDQYSIQNVPTLVVFRDGEAVLTREGQLQEDELRVVLRGLGVFRESDDMRARARDRHMAGDTPGAIMLLTEAIRKDPANTRVAMDMVQIFIDMGELAQAKQLFNKLPEPDGETTMGRSLTGQLAFADLAAATEGVDVLQGRVAQDGADHAARFDLAVCLVNQHDYDRAMDHLFAVMESEPDFRDGAAREMIATIANMLAPNVPGQAQTYRRRLANLLSG